MMDQELKKKWLEALRSGRYTQGRNLLKGFGGLDKTTPFHCCLGVLCEVAGLQEYRTGLGGSFFWIDGDASQTELPASFRRSAGIDPLQHERLIKMNDGGPDFREIADWIEAVL